MLELKEVERKNKNKQATIRGTGRRGKEQKEKKKTMQRAGRKDEKKEEKNL